METIDRIPTSKIQRATKIITTGAKVGVNYARFYGKKLVKSEEEAKEELNQQNAEDNDDGSHGFHVIWGLVAEPYELLVPCLGGLELKVDILCQGEDVELDQRDDGVEDEIHFWRERNVDQWEMGCDLEGVHRSKYLLHRDWEDEGDQEVQDHELVHVVLCLFFGLQ